MNKKDAIEWLRNKFQGRWPTETNSPAPEGWRWVVRNLPYQWPAYLLTNAVHEEIEVGEVYL